MTDPRPWPIVAVKALAILAMGLYLLHLMTAGVDEQTTDRREQVEVQDAPSTVWERHDRHCWKGDEEPLVEIPGHVVWQHPDGRVVYSKALTGPALDTTFGSGDLPGRPIGFCK